MIFLFNDKAQQPTLMQGEVVLGKIEPEVINDFFNKANVKRDYMVRRNGQEIYVSHHKQAQITILVLKPVVGGFRKKIKYYQATTSKEAKRMGVKAFKYIKKRKFM